MPLLIDTSVAIELIDNAPGIVERRRNQEGAVYLSVVTRIELVPGCYPEGEVDPVVIDRVAELLSNLGELPFTVQEAQAYERIIAARGFSRRMVVDRMIAATALANDLTLATLNPRDFRDIPGLNFEDWSA